MRAYLAPLAVLFVATLVSAGEPAGAEDFAAKMSNVEMVGSATIEGSGKEPQEDRYTIVKVEKGEDDKYIFYWKVTIAGKELTVPVAVPVKWAGTTPVLSLDELTVPGVGTYSAKIVIDGERYAGTWSGGGHGGHLWGKIEKIKK